MPIDLERLKAQCVYESQVPLATLLSDLDAIAGAVERWKGFRRTVRIVSTLVLVVAAVCIFTEFFLVGFVALAIGIAGFVYAYKYARGVVTHLQRGELVKRFAAMLANDCHPKAPVTVKLVLKDARVLLKEGPWTQRKNGKQQFFTEPWLNLEATMLDGTVVHQGITDLVRVRRYSNPRNKSKMKTRVRHLVSMRFVYPPELYGDLRKSGARLKDPFKLPASVHVKALAITEHDVKIKARVDQTPDLARACTILSLGAYRILNLGRRVAAHRGGAR